MHRESGWRLRQGWTALGRVAWATECDLGRRAAHRNGCLVATSLRTAEPRWTSRSIRTVILFSRSASCVNAARRVVPGSTRRLIAGVSGTVAMKSYVRTLRRGTSTCGWSLSSFKRMKCDAHWRRGSADRTCLRRARGASAHQGCCHAGRCEPLGRTFREVNGLHCLTRRQPFDSKLPCDCDAMCHGSKASLYDI